MRKWKSLFNWLLLWYFYGPFIFIWWRKQFQSIPVKYRPLVIIGKLFLKFIMRYCIRKLGHWWQWNTWRNMFWLCSAKFPNLEVNTNINFYLQIFFVHFLIRFPFSTKPQWLCLAALIVLLLGSAVVFVYFTKFEVENQAKIFHGNAVVSNGEECAEIGM